MSGHLEDFNSNFKMASILDGKWPVFLSGTKVFREFERLNAKDAENSIKSFRNIAANITPLILEFSEFLRKCEELSKLCKYWNGIVEMTNRLQNLVLADREGNWDNRIQAVSDLLPIFTEADRINYLHYASWYFESTRQLHINHPDVNKQFKANHMFVVKQIQEASML